MVMQYRSRLYSLLQSSIFLIIIVLQHVISFVYSTKQRGDSDMKDKKFLRTVSDDSIWIFVRLFTSKYPPDSSTSAGMGMTLISAVEDVQPHSMEHKRTSGNRFLFIMLKLIVSWGDGSPSIFPILFYRSPLNPSPLKSMPIGDWNTRRPNVGNTAKTCSNISLCRCS